VRSYAAAAAAGIAPKGLAARGARRRPRDARWAPAHPMPIFAR
jgi:hypothetical protein